MRWALKQKVTTKLKVENPPLSTKNHNYRESKNNSKRHSKNVKKVTQSGELPLKKLTKVNLVSTPLNQQLVVENRFTWITDRSLQASDVFRSFLGMVLPAKQVILERL